MLRRALALLSLAATAACGNDSYSPLDPPPAVQRYIAVVLTTGDSLDLVAVAMTDFGLYDIRDCTTSSTDVATLEDGGLLLARTAGETVITCMGALNAAESGEDPDVPAVRRWAPFEIRLVVRSPDEFDDAVPELDAP
jgi:hypothetical protein